MESIALSKQALYQLSYISRPIDTPFQKASTTTTFCMSLYRGHIKGVKCKFSVEAAVERTEWSVNVEYESENVGKTF